MANDYMDQWDANGVLYDLHDKGRGQPNGVATLDPNGRIPYSQLPESAVEVKGYWNAETNTPELADGTGTNGDEYFVDTAGTQDLGSGEQYFGVGDRVLYLNGVWKNIDSRSIKSVNHNLPDTQGNVSIDMDNSNLWTRKWRSKVFGSFLGRTFKQANITRYIWHVIHANGLFVAATASGCCWSEDGITWEEGTGDNVGTPCMRLTIVNGIWFCQNSQTSPYPVYKSEDGKNWVAVSTIASLPIYEKGIYIAHTTTSLVWSDDLDTWNTGLSSIGTDTTAVVYNAQLDLFVAPIGTNSGSAVSTDGKTWTKNNASVSYGEILTINNIFVSTEYAVRPGQGPQYHGVVTSTDGLTWTVRLTGATEVKIAEDMFYAKNSSGACYYSADAISWSSCGVTLDTAAFLTVKKFCNTYLLCGDTIYCSFNGTKFATCEVKGTDDASFVYDVNYANGCFICISSTTKGHLYSIDGIHWINTRNTFMGPTTAASINHSYCIYFNGTWVIAGANGLWYSDVDSLEQDGYLTD